VHQWRLGTNAEIIKKVRGNQDDEKNEGTQVTGSGFAKSG